MDQQAETGAIKNLEDMSELVSLCKRRGYVFPSSEVYGGINACWDYGPLGVELKRNVKESWWRAMTDRTDIEGLDAAIMMHPKVWQASGHVEGFTDPLVDCKKCKSRFREDQIDAALVAQKKCPSCGGEITAPRQFNLMFKTFMGPLEDSAAVVYLRPETAQGIYVNFQNVLQTSRQRIPFGIAQIGKAFRNEITPGNFIFRTREFEQMEMQYFVKPGADEASFETWKELRFQWHLSNGIRPEKLRLHQHAEGELAHYAKAAFDIQYEFPFGWQELEGIHNRTDFDLKRHEQFSGKKLEYFDEVGKERYIPYVVETSAGCDRTLLVLLVDAYRAGADRVWLKLHPKLAPYKVGLFPLMKKPELMEYTDRVFADVRKQFRTFVDEAGSIGKRYRRQDEIGTPYGVTIDYDTLSNHTVTIRDRDTMAQERIPAEKICQVLQERIESWKP